MDINPNIIQLTSINVYPKRRQLLTLILLTFAVTFAPRSSQAIDKYFYEVLPENRIETLRATELEYLETGEDFTRSCFIKINHKAMCIEYGPKCEFKFEWSLPEHLIERTKKGFDARMRILDDAPYQIPSKPDHEVYASHLLIANIGYAHRGIWSCNFKFINRESGKVDSWQNIFEIQIKDDGSRGTVCDFDDQCSSSNCTDSHCICDADLPIEIDGVCHKAPSIGENCRNDSDCQINVDNSTCLNSKPKSDDGESSGRKMCQCSGNHIPVTLGLGKHRCLKKAKLNQPCERSQQCEAIDKNTFCSFAGTCECRQGRRCASPSIRPCQNKSECESFEYCGNGRCQTLKDLNEACSQSEECEERQICSASQKECVCEKGHKASSLTMTCIPEDYCLNDLDCPKGYCKDNNCLPGVKLGGNCRFLKQCQALDDNSICDEDSGEDRGKCICGPNHFESRKGICIVEGHCLVNEDCTKDEKGICRYEHCIYLKKLGEYCGESEQCFLQTSYSHCHADSLTCKCLNGPLNDDGDCRKERDCSRNSDCLSKQLCNNKTEKCYCVEGYHIHNDGYCYKKRLVPDDDDDSFWLDFVKTYAVYLAAGVGVLVFIFTFLVCVKCCGHKRPSRPTREGHEAPVTGRYVAQAPSAPPATLTRPSNISGNF